MERAIVNYFILSAPSIDELIVKVRTQMEQGYQPLGGVSVLSLKDGKFFQFFQAIAKYG